MVRAVAEAPDIPGMVKGIVSTYDLPEKRSRWLSRAARQRAEFFGFCTFDQIYEDIARLVDGTGLNYSARGVSLSTPRGHGSSSTLYDILGDKPTKPEGEGQPISIGLAVDVLATQLDEIDISLLRQMIQLNGTRDISLTVTPEQLAEHAEQIHSRLVQVARQYGEGDRLVIPHRPIIFVDFDPLKIKFGRRNFNGNPLAFFKEHQDVYGGMTRTQLQEFDYGLYQALNREEQLSLAIPERLKEHHTIDPEMISKIKSTLQSNGGNVSGAATALSLSPKTVRKYARLEEIKLQGRGDNMRLTEDEQRRIDEAYETYMGNALLASQHLPFRNDTIGARWKDMGKKARGKMLPESKCRDIIEAHESSHGNQLAAAKSLNVNKITVARHWKKAKLVA